MNDLNYDPYQFANRGSFPASAATNIAFSDYGRMHTERHYVNPAAWVPPFARNDKQLQQVLLLRAAHYIHGGHRIPAPIDREKINRAATAKALRGYDIGAHAPQIQHEIVKKHAAAVRKAGGYLQLLAAIAFRSWRLGMNSVQVAESLGTTPVAVRQMLWRLKHAAKELGFDAGPARVTKRTYTQGRNKIKSRA